MGQHGAIRRCAPGEGGEGRRVGAWPRGAPHAAPCACGVGVRVPISPGTLMCSAFHSGVGRMLLVRVLGPFCRVQAWKEPKPW